MASDAMVVAWESSSWLWNDFGHGLGAFVTSGGAAGFAAVAVGAVGVRQYFKARRHDQIAADRTRIWEQFRWFATHSDGIDPTAKARILVSLRNAASDYDDDELAPIIDAYRRKPHFADQENHQIPAHQPQQPPLPVRPVPRAPAPAATPAYARHSRSAEGTAVTITELVARVAETERYPHR